MNVKLCPSIEEYQHDLPAHGKDISDLVKSGADALHIELKRMPFCDRESFADFSWIYKEFSDGIRLQFHAMARHPYELMFKIAEAMPDLRARSNTMITIPFEAYRQTSSDQNTDVQPIDELHIGNLVAPFLVATNLKSIRYAGFQTGLSLEPSTSLDSLTPDIIRSADQITLMGVPRGQEYMTYDDSFLAKIRNARNKGLRVQAEGGIGYADLEVVADAGAHSIVLGSYVTLSDDPGYMVREIREQLARSTIK